MSMEYFEDLKLLGGGHCPGYAEYIDRGYPDFHSLQYNRSGKLLLGVDGGKRVALEGAVLFWFLPEHVYQYGAPAGDVRDHYWLTFRGDRGRRIVRDGFAKLSESGYVQVGDPAGFCKLFMEVIEITHAADPSRLPRACLALESMLVSLVEARRATQAESPAAVAVRELAGQIRLDPLADWDFHVLARRRLRVSYSHFRRLFKQVMAAAPTEYLLYCRFQLAASRMLERELPVKEAAALCGYDNPSVFSRVFKSVVGLSPKRYVESMPGR